MVGKAGKETTMSIYPLFTSVMMGAAYVVGLVRMVFSFLLSIHIDVRSAGYKNTFDKGKDS